jgi:ubiquinone/menaquinone biosynthesis C-methylase UbiE
MHDKQYKAPPEKLRSEDRIRLLEIERVVRLCLADGKIAAVLDVGCGTGLFSEAFTRQKIGVTGIDLNRHMVASAKKHVAGAAFLEGTAEALPFRDHAFDLVFLGHVLHESDDPSAVLRESKRVAKKFIGILEWPYQHEIYGPPLEHRLPIQRIQKWIDGVGFRDWTFTRLIHMQFYKIYV